VSVPIIDADGICVAGVQVAGDILDLTEDRVPILSIEVRRAASAHRPNLLTTQPHLI